MLAIDFITAHRKPGTSLTPDFIKLGDNGAIVWVASLVLQHYLCQHQGALKGKRVLELGSGLGHFAWGLCRMGARVTCTELAAVLPQLRASLDEQLASSRQMGHEPLGTIEAVELAWGQDAWARSPLSTPGTPRFDVIILAEVVYNTNFHDALLWTLDRFSHPDVVIYSVLVDRPFSFAFFSSLADTGRYDVEPITGFDALGMEEVCMHKITLKPGAECLCACV